MENESEPIVEATVEPEGTPELPEIVVPSDEVESVDPHPELIAPGELRLRQRNRLTSMAIRVRNVFGIAEDSTGDENVTLEFSGMSDEKLDRVLDLMAEVDEFAESIAVDRPAYIAWSKRRAQSNDYSAFLDILSEYSSAVGESSSSSN